MHEVGLQDLGTVIAMKSCYWSRVNKYNEERWILESFLYKKFPMITLMLLKNNKTTCSHLSIQFRRLCSPFLLSVTEICRQSSVPLYFRDRHSKNKGQPSRKRVIACVTWCKMNFDRNHPMKTIEGHYENCYLLKK